MPGWVEDPSLGNIMMDTYNGMQAAPGKALSNIAMADKIKQARYQEELTKKAVADFPGAVPPASVLPQKFTAADIADPAVLNAPLSVLGSGPDMTFKDPRELALREATRKAGISGSQAAIYQDPSKWAPMLGFSRVAARGPAAPGSYDRVEDQFYTTGRYPTSDESKVPNAQNFTVVDAQGNATGQGFASVTGGRTAIDGTPIRLKPGERIMETGPAPLAVANPLENEATARKELEAIEARRIQRGYLTDAEGLRIPKLVDVVSPLKRVVEQEGGQAVEKQVRVNVLPPWLANLDALGQEYAAGMARPGPGYTPPPQLPVLSQGGLGKTFDPIALDAAAVSPSRLPAAPATAAAPAPIVDPNATRIISKGPANPAELRKEVRASQEFQDYQTAIPSYQTMVEATKLEPTNATDLNVIYAIAKLFDPGSVVREGELKLAASTGTMGQVLSAAFSRLVSDKGTLDPQTRANLIEQARVRMQQYKQNKDMAAEQYSKIAQNSGLDPALIIPQLPEMPEFDKAAVARGGTGPRPGAPKRRAADDLLGE